MKIDQLLESLGLCSEMFDARDTTQIQKTESKKKPKEEKSELKLVSETDKQKTNNKPKIPTRCINCIRKGEKNGQHYCKGKRVLISWPIENEITCEQFKLMKCEACGFYEHGLCTAYDNNIGKSPGDECDYDAICFM